MTPNEIQRMLKRLDEEITGHRQQIAMHQVEIARLEDSRRVFMSLAEADQHRTNGHAQDTTPTLANGSHAKPVLIVRKTTQDTPPPAEPAPRKKGKRDNSKRAAWRAKIIEYFKDPQAEPAKVGEIANYFGVTGGWKAKEHKDLANALFYLAQAGTLHKDSEGRYSAPTRQ